MIIDSPTKSGRFFFVSGFVFPDFVFSPSRKKTERTTKKFTILWSGGGEEIRQQVETITFFYVSHENEKKKKTNKVSAEYNSCCATTCCWKIIKRHKSNNARFVFNFCSNSNQNTSSHIRRKLLFADISLTTSFCVLNSCTRIEI